MSAICYLDIVPLSIWQEIATKHVEFCRLLVLAKKYYRHDVVPLYKQIYIRCFVDGSGDKIWRLTWNGKIHRDSDLPAIETAEGTKEWYKHNRRRRENDKPTIETIRGHKLWVDESGLHRGGDLPAIEYPNGDKFWYQNNKRHRANGKPAVIYSDGYKEWWINHWRVAQFSPVTGQLEGKPYGEHYHSNDYYDYHNYSSARSIPDISTAGNACKWRCPISGRDISNRKHCQRDYLTPTAKRTKYTK